METCKNGTKRRRRSRRTGQKDERETKRKRARKLVQAKPGMLDMSLSLYSLVTGVEQVHPSFPVWNEGGS